MGENLKGIVIKKGYVPDDTIASEIAHDVARTGSNVIVTEVDAHPLAKKEGLPVQLEVDKRTFSKN